MCDRTNDSPTAPADVVRARRFELVDDLGNVRAVLGNLAHHPDADFWPGLTLRNAHGRDRIWLMVHDFGPELAFDMGGNSVLILEVHDPGTDAIPGVSITLCDADGKPVYGWRVKVDGEVEFRGPAS